MREARVLLWIDNLRQDLVHGARMFRRQPTITALVVLTLSLGIGANATIFSLLHAAILRPMSFLEPDRLVFLVEGSRTEGTTNRPYTPAVMDVRARSRTLESVSYFAENTYQVSGGTEPERISGVSVEASFFEVVGARPAHGRLFRRADATAGGRRGGAGAVVVISDALWRRSFDADPAVIGRPLNVDSEPHVIVGVLPPDFSLYGIGPWIADIYVPANSASPAMTWTGAEAANYVPRTTAVARLAREVEIEAASAELEALAAVIAAEHPNTFGTAGSSPRADYFMRAEPIGNIEGYDLLYVLFGAVAFVVLIACANAIQFLLAQAIQREPEVALRTALGARRMRLVRQFLSEALLLLIAVGALALLQTVWLIAVIRSLIGPGPVTEYVVINVPVLRFLAGVTVATIIASSLMPALRFSRAEWAPRLASRGVRHRNRSRHLLIGVQIALSFVLLVGTGLVLRSTLQLQRRDRGFSTDDVSVMSMRGIGERSLLPLTHRRILEQVAGVPGVEHVAISSMQPAGYEGHSAQFAVVAASAQAAGARQTAWYDIASPDFFDVLRIPLVAGRVFTASDTVGAEPVAIINREIAERFWPEGSPLGHRIVAGQGDRLATMTIVGVVGNVTPLFQRRPVPQIWAPYLQQTERSVTLWIRMARDVSLPTMAIKKAVWSIQPDQALFNVSSLDQVVWDSTSTHRIVTGLIGSFAVLAMVMSLAGIYALIVFLTSRRLKEIAIRRAIGASQSDILWLLGRQTLRSSIAGLALGAGGAYLATRAAQATIPGLLPLDTPTVALIGAVYLVVVCVAMGLATIKALHVDPASALRAE
jgi:putative ABC transport system permease protein